MGVDFYTCACCGESVCDAGNYNYCEYCCKYFCNDTCSGQTYDSDDDSDNHWGECRYCQGTDATDEQLLNFLLKKVGMTYDSLKEEYIKVYNSDGDK